MSVDRLLSIYGQPVQSWPGEEALDEEARANLAALRPQQQPKLRTDETFRGTFLPFRETVDGKHEWAVPAFLQDVWDAATAVRDTSGTGLGPMPRPSQYSPEVFEQILGHGMAGALTGITGNLPRLMVKPPAGTTELGIFGGRNAKTANQEMLAKAEQMAADGTPREDIWKQTGWFQGVDGKWRFEIDDSGARFDASGVTATMPSRLRMAEDIVVIEMGLPKNKLYNDAEVQALALREADSRLEAARAAERGQPIASSMVHDDLFRAYPEHGGIGVAHENLPGYAGTFNDGRITFGGGQALGRGQSDSLSTVLHELQHATQRAEDFAVGGSKEAAGADAYRRLAGETEARLVQSRRDLTPEQRLANPPWQEGPYGYDVPESQQIVRFGNEGMSTAAKPPLDMSPEARLARAREMGFDTDRTYYRGDSGVRSPTGATWITSNPEYASVFAGDNGVVMPVLKRDGNYLDLTRFDAEHGFTPEQFARLAGIDDASVVDDLSRLVGPDGTLEAFQAVDLPSVQSALAKQGYDGAHVNQYVWGAGAGDGILVFDPTHTRSVAADFDPSLSSSPNIMASMGDEGGRGAIQQRALDALGYYSAAVEAAKGIKQPRGTPEQMLAQLRKVGVKDAEIQATGLDQLFASGKAVTRDQIVDHLEKSRLALNEVVYPRLNPEAVEVMRKNFPDIGEEELARMAKRDETRWSDYSLDPKNPTYQETVLHLPKADAEAMMKTAYEAAQKRYADAVARQETIDRRNPRLSPEEQAIIDEVKAATVELQRTSQPVADLNFTSGHFDEPNIVGHMMTSETYLPGTGQKVFTLDQIQSDWGQRLRDGGVRDEAKIAALQREVDLEREKTREFIQKRAEQLKRDIETSIGGGSQGYEFSLNEAKRIVSIDREMMAPHNAEMDRLRAELATAKASASGHPLVNTTDQWTNVVLRRAIRKAAESGADYIAIPTGDTVLSYNSGDAHGMAQFYGRRPRDKVAIGDDLEPLPSSESRGAVEGIVPKNLRKLLTKIDKKSPPPRMVDTLDSPSGATGLGQGFTLFPLTDKVKKEVMNGGQPLFSKGGAVAGPTLRRLAQRNAKPTTSVDDALDH